MEFLLVRRFFGITMLLHMLILQNVIYIEGALCETPSETFRGLCFISHNCLLVCEKEGFTSGRCVGFRHRCICGKSCNTGTPGVPSGSGGAGGGEGGGGEDPDTPSGGDGGEVPGTQGGGEGGEVPGTQGGGEGGEDPDTRDAGVSGGDEGDEDPGSPSK